MTGIQNKLELACENICKYICALLYPSVKKDFEHELYGLEVESHIFNWNIWTDFLLNI